MRLVFLFAFGSIVIAAGIALSPYIVPVLIALVALFFLFVTLVVIKNYS